MTVPSDKVTAQRVDLSRADTTHWPQREFRSAAARSSQDVPVVLRRSVLTAIHEHGSERTDVEICGVLVGAGYRAADGAYVLVAAIIRGVHAGSQLAQVTFTGETWAHIHAAMDRDYSDQQIVGWYHTHPGFGIFLSPMDLFIHQNFFSAPEQLAFVYDPVRQQEGLFVWRNGAAVLSDFVIEEDVPMTPAAVVTISLPAGDDLGEPGTLPSASNTRWLRYRGFIGALLTAISIAALIFFTTALVARRPLDPGPTDEISDEAAASDQRQTPNLKEDRP